MAAQESWKDTGMLAGVTDCRRSQKWGCKRRWALGFKPRPGSHRESRPRGSEGKERGPGSGSSGEVKRGLLLVGHEKVPHGFGLTGDRSSHTADGAGSLNHGILLPFLRHGTPDWAQGEGRTVHLWVF